MALERIPSQIRKQGGVARMSDPSMIRRIQAAVDIPVMAKCRIGHIVEAQILEALEIDFIDESEVLTPADEANHVWKHEFKVPLVAAAIWAKPCVGSARARMIRTKGEAGTGNVVEAVRHMRAVVSHMKRLTTLTADGDGRGQGAGRAVELSRSQAGRLPVLNFAAGGVVIPADAALMMKLGPKLCSWARDLGWATSKPKDRTRTRFSMARPSCRLSPTGTGRTC
jgi:pyridoxal 5'-phosphate synthase pdxS subunit